MKDIMEGISPLPTCVITGRIAGDDMACGDCDPCIFGASMVPQCVKNLMAERDEFVSRYENEATKNDLIRDLYPELVEALKVAQYYLPPEDDFADDTERADRAQVNAILAKCKAGAE